MLDQEHELISMDDVDVTLYEDELISFKDFKFSDSVLESNNVELPSMVEQYLKTNHNYDFFDILQSSIVWTDTIVHMLDSEMNNNVMINNEQVLDDDWDQNLDYTVLKEIIIPEENQQDMSQMQEQVGFLINESPFDLIGDAMTVKEQPKPDQRARYDSDGKRFLPDSRKHPMSIELPDLSSVSLAENQSFGIILTMVTTTSNPKNKTFVHINGIKYDTKEAMEIDHGSIFLPITKLDIEKSEKLFPRLSIIRKKFHEYTFDLISFDPLNVERETEKYTLINEDVIGKAAKGKQFTTDYDLLCYKIVFQLALRQDNEFTISHIQCETNIINEQKTSTKGVKRKATSSDKTSKKRKDRMNKLMINPSKKSKPSVLSFIERPVTRRSNRKIKQTKGSSMDNS